MKNLPKNHQGVSLPIVIGLVVLLSLASAAINLLIIRNLRAVQNIEASNRAYMAAEAGLEDALYELSARSAGYETPSLSDANLVRKINFGGETRLESNWEIKSLSNSTSFTGRIKGTEKLVINLYNDNGGKNGTNFIKTAENAINATSPQITDIKTLNADSFAIRFSIPLKTYAPNGTTEPAFSSGLIIDNDNDAWGANGMGINEDGKDDNGFCGTSGFEGPDSDCDGKTDEDSEEDVVIYWKLSDGAGNELTALPGCLTDNGIIQYKGTEICEKDFILGTDTLEVTLRYTDLGNDGTTTIGEFIKNTANSTPNNKLKIEFLITAPLQQVDQINQKKIPIPYLEYKVTSNLTTIPKPFFTIKSDGYSNQFKQSLKALVTPNSVVPIFDFTILQQ